MSTHTGSGGGLTSVERLAVEGDDVLGVGDGVDEVLPEALRVAHLKACDPQKESAAIAEG